MPDPLLNELLKRATSIGPGPQSKLDNAVEVAKQHPRGQMALEGVKHVINSDFLTKLVGMLPGAGKWTQSYGRSFTVPQIGTVIMAPNDPNYSETFAHELGHITQHQNNPTLFRQYPNDNTSNVVKRDLIQEMNMRESLQPRPIKPIPSYLATLQQDVDEMKGTR